MEVINCFWTGGNLNESGIISINSFICTGHILHLWHYKEVTNAPVGVVHRNASEIVPLSVFKQWFPEGFSVDYRKTKIPTFACYFRYKLIHKIGGWWCDADIIALRLFDFIQDYVFCGQYFDDPQNEVAEGLRITNGTFKCPKECELLAKIIEEIEDKAINAKDPGWGEWGPKYFTKKIIEFDLLKHKLENNVFAPFPPGNSSLKFQFFDTNVEIPNWAYALHLFNRSSMDIMANKDSLYDIYRRKYCRENYYMGL